MAVRVTERAEQPWGEYGKRLLAQMRLHDWTIDDVAVAGEVDRGQVSRWLSPNQERYQEPKLPTIRRVAAGLNIPIEDLTGRSEEPEITAEEREWLLIYRGAPPEHRPRLRRIVIEATGMIRLSDPSPDGPGTMPHFAARERAARPKANGSRKDRSNWLNGQDVNLQIGA